MATFLLKFKGIGIFFNFFFLKFQVKHKSKPIKSRTGYEKALGTVEAIGKFETKPDHIILGYSR